MTVWQPPPGSDAGSWHSPEAGLPNVRYQRLGTIGAGAMGEVALGWDAWLHRNVALKTPHGPAGSPAEAALLREALLVARLDHPAIVSVLDLFRDDAGRAVFVMRVARGRPITAWLSEGRRGPVLRGLIAAAEALSHAHDRGVVHRDLSPHNLLLGEHGEVSVVDWGIAAQVGADGAPGAGTHGFAAPEQLLGAVVQPTADVWSLGALLRAALDEDASPELRAIADRACSPAPAERYPNAGALRADLLNWAEGRLVDAYAYRPLQVVRHGLYAARRPLAVVAVVLIATLAQGAAYTRSLQVEQAKVIAAEAEARRRLADARAGQALAAWRVGDELDAANLAGLALEAGPQPLATGILAATALWPDVTTRALAALPPCGRWALPGDGDVALCLGDGFIDAYPTGGPPWRFDRSVSEVRAFDGALWLLDNVRALWRLRPADGAVLSHDPGPYALLDPIRPDRATERGDRLVEPGAPPLPCTERAHAITTDDLGHLWVSCEDGAVFRLSPQEPPAPIQSPSLDATALLIPVDGGVWSANRAGQLRRLTGPPTQIELGEPVRFAARWPGRRGVFVLGRAGRARLLDVDSGAWRLELPSGAAAAAVTPAGAVRMILQGELVEVSAPDALARPAWRSAHGISALAWEPDGRHLRIGDGSGELHRVDWTSATPDVSERWQSLVLKWVDVGPTGAWIATGMGRPPISGATADGSPLRVPPALDQPLRRVAVLADDAVIALTYGGRVIRAAAERVETLHAEESVGDLARDLAGVHVVFTAPSGLRRWSNADGLRLIDRESWTHADVEGDVVVAARGDEVAVFTPTGTRRWRVDRPIPDLALTADGRIVLGQQDGAVLITTLDGVVLARAPLHTDRVGALEVSPDGRLVASGGWDGLVRVIDLNAVPAAARAGVSAQSVP